MVASSGGCLVSGQQFQPTLSKHGSPDLADLKTAVETDCSRSTQHPSTQAASHTHPSQVEHLQARGGGKGVGQRAGELVVGSGKLHGRQGQHKTTASVGSACWQGV